MKDKKLFIEKKSYPKLNLPQKVSQLGKKTNLNPLKLKKKGGY